MVLLLWKRSFKDHSLLAFCYFQIIGIVLAISMVWNVFRTNGQTENDDLHKGQEYWTIKKCLLYLVDSLVGRTFKSIRNSADLAATLGINVMANKMLAFAIASFFTAIAGVLYAHYIPRTVEFREALPRTIVGKVLRRQLVEEEKTKLASKSISWEVFSAWFSLKTRPSFVEALWTRIRCLWTSGQCPVV